MMEDSNNKKFDYSKRTFETRLQFIHDIFSSKYSQSAIMSRCIEYKLGKSYQAYVKEIEDDLWKIYGEDPLKILKKLD